MNIRTGLQLMRVRDEYYKNYLTDQLDKGFLTDKQLRYLVDNLNTDDYIRQNMIPVAEAMKNNISVEAIEECASILPDACGHSIFAFESDKGKLFNKIPNDLQHVLKLNDISWLSYCMEQNRDKQISECKNILKATIDLLYESRDLGTITESDEFWNLIANDGVIKEHMCDYIKKYNHEIQKCKSIDRNIYETIPTINSLMDSGLHLYDISRINFDQIKSLCDSLKSYESELLKNDDLKEIKILSDTSYDLFVEKFTNVKLVSDYEYGAREESFTDTSITFKNRNNPEDDFISLNDQDFMKLLIGVSLIPYKDVIRVHTETYEAKLQSEIDKKSLGEFNISDMMEQLSNNTYYGVGERITKISLTTGDDTLTMEGEIFEPSYECFSVRTNLLLNGKNVMQKFDKLEDAIQYLKENIDVDKLKIKDSNIVYENGAISFKEEIKTLKDPKSIKEMARAAKKALEKSNQEKGHDVKDKKLEISV